MCVEGAVKCNINLIYLPRVELQVTEHSKVTWYPNKLQDGKNSGLPLHYYPFLGFLQIFAGALRSYTKHYWESSVQAMRLGSSGDPIANGQHICHICDVLWWSRMIYDDVLDSGTWFLFPLPCSSRGVWWLLPESKNWQWGQFGVSGTLGCNNQETRGAWGLGLNWGPELETHTVWLC